MENTEEYNVPLYMLKRRTDGAWLFGKEAKEAEDDGVLTDNLFEKARLGKTVRIDREEYLAKDYECYFIKNDLIGLLKRNQIVSFDDFLNSH